MRIVETSPSDWQRYRAFLWEALRREPVAFAAASEEAEAATSIPPNCIYVCCDGTCDSWKMCLTCVEWPKPTTTRATLASR
jgi:hypothetical protein